MGCVVLAGHVSGKGIPKVVGHLYEHQQLTAARIPSPQRFFLHFFTPFPKARPSPHINPSPALQKKHLTGLRCQVELREKKSQDSPSQYPELCSSRSRLSFLLSVQRH